MGREIGVQAAGLVRDLSTGRVWQLFGWEKSGKRKRADVQVKRRKKVLIIICIVTGSKGCRLKRVTNESVV